jgi:hypothetical protein
MIEIEKEEAKSENEEQPQEEDQDEDREEEQPDGDDNGNEDDEDNDGQESPEQHVQNDDGDEDQNDDDSPERQNNESPGGGANDLRSREEGRVHETLDNDQEEHHDEGPDMDHLEGSPGDHHQDMDDDEEGSPGEHHQDMDEEEEERYRAMHEEEEKHEERKEKHFFDSIDTEEFVMPGVFDVEIKLADNQIKIVTVEVEKAKKEKPYIGGFVNRRDERKFYHAFTQTDQQSTYHPQKLTREVQTYQYDTKSSVMMREFGTQMEKPGLFIDSRKDKRVKPRPYFSSDSWKKQRWDRTLFIQCQIRGWFARRRAAELRKKRNDRDLELLRKQEELRKREEETHKEEIERRMHPKKDKDFEILYEELEAWRLSETKKIKASTELKDEEKKLALQQLLYKETKILQQIDRLKITANVANKEEKINKFLKAMSDPKNWHRSDERMTEVHTPFTTRAKELMDLYNGLKLPYLSIDERLDVLLHTKWTVREFDCNLTREIVDLIDREADMLNRGRSEASLEGLRKRLANLFLQFIETPEFNPEAARFQKVPRELLKQTQSIIFE